MKKQDELHAEARSATQLPGVYLMKDVRQHVVYVGKAKNLRNRLSSYFAHEHNDPKTRVLVKIVASYDVLVTESETEALLLEATLIKKYRPRFNIRLKDDKAYPYLRIDRGSFPRLTVTRQRPDDGSRYFGPFPSAWAARTVAHVITVHLGLRDCSDNAFRHRSRPCMLYEMKQCVAPCVGYVDTYQALVHEAEAILSGSSQVVQRALETQMEQAIFEEAFEQAGVVRDQLMALELVMRMQSAVDANNTQRSQDILACHAMHGMRIMVREGRVVGSQHVVFEDMDEVSVPELLRVFILQKCLESPPDEVIVATMPDESELIQQTLPVRLPQGEYEEQLLRVALLNAVHAEKTHQKQHPLRSLEEAQSVLGMKDLPRRIECYDISNLQGDDAVASRVVFIDARAEPSLYRRYKMEGEQNDFAMMRQVLMRRFARTEDTFPELVVVDGGKGQLAQAVMVLSEVGFQGSVVGLAKARTESMFRSSEVCASSERLFVPGRKNPILLKPGTALFQLMTSVRDEAHRFALAYNRALRRKRFT